MYFLVITGMEPYKKEETKNRIQKFLWDIFCSRLELYYGEDYLRSKGKESRMIIKGTSSGLSSYRPLKPDEKQFSEAFDYLWLECKTVRLFFSGYKDLMLVRGRDNLKMNSIINMAIDEDDGIKNLQILKILCKKLLVFCAKIKLSKSYIYSHIYWMIIWKIMILVQNEA